MKNPLPAELISLIPTYRDGLLTDVIPFWMKHAFDSQFGGFMTAVGERGEVVDTDKSVWAQGRSAWMLSKLYNHPLCQHHSDRPRWLEMALSTCQFLGDHCFDPNDGRMWFHVTRDGKPIRKRRYSYSESFAAIAFGELYKAVGNEHFKSKAISLLKQFIERNKSTNQEHPKFTDTRPTRSIGFPMIAMVTIQQLRESIGTDAMEFTIDPFIEEIQKYFVRPEIECVMETVSMDGSLLDHFDGRTLNPGHAMEASWFIMEEGRVRKDADMIALGTKMLDWMWARGWDREHGGIFYFVGIDEKPVQEYWHDMKFWWPHNEATIATLLAYELTGDTKYIDWFQCVNDWTHQHFPDPEHGEWFGYLHRDGSISSRLKGNLWKGPFHIPRMQLTCWDILERLKAKHSQKAEDAL